MWNVDIRGAFLAAPMDAELFMNEPPGFETVDDDGATGRWVARLDRALYGAKQSANLWRKRLHEWLATPSAPAVVRRARCGQQTARGQHHGW